jgi:hypothetical protein
MLQEEFLYEIGKIIAEEREQIIIKHLNNVNCDCGISDFVFKSKNNSQEFYFYCNKCGTEIKLKNFIEIIQKMQV